MPLCIDSRVYFTPHLKVPYLKSPGVALLAAPDVDLSGLANYLQGFDPSLGFQEYLDDPDDLAPAEELIKFAGQACYASLGPKRTWNQEAQRYFTNLLASGHGSVLEHAQFSFFFWGVSRSLTHELVRHRAGFAFSQLSQRYVDGNLLRFVERPEYVNNPALHHRFEESIELAKAAYEARAEQLLDRLAAQFPDDMPKTERRKRVNQAARSVLPNETETSLVTSANLRAWRHFLEMRCAGPAEVEIRRLAHLVYQFLAPLAPRLFADYTEVTLPDGTTAVDTPYRKV